MENVIHVLNLFLPTSKNRNGNEKYKAIETFRRNTVSPIHLSKFERMEAETTTY